MNRPVRSILRHAAQGYALGHIGLDEYRSFRRKVLEAIIDGREPPTVPIHWLQAPVSPDDRDERRGGRIALKALLVFLLVFGSGAAAVYQYKPELWNQAGREISKLFRPRLEGPLGDFQQLSYNLLEKDVWSNTDISRAMRTWDQLSAADKIKARTYDWYQTLMQDADQRVDELRELEKFSSDKDSLRGQADAITMLTGALNSRR